MRFRCEGRAPSTDPAPALRLRNLSPRGFKEVFVGCVSLAPRARALRPSAASPKGGVSCSLVAPGSAPLSAVCRGAWHRSSPAEPQCPELGGARTDPRAVPWDPRSSCTETAAEPGVRLPSLSPCPGQQQRGAGGQSRAPGVLGTPPCPCPLPPGSGTAPSGWDGTGAPAQTGGMASHGFRRWCGGHRIS